MGSSPASPVRGASSPVESPHDPRPGHWIEAEDCRRSLDELLDAGWPSVEPGEPYRDSRHVPAIREHLQAVTAGQILELVVNIPPGLMKSPTKRIQAGSGVDRPTEHQRPLRLKR